VGDEVEIRDPRRRLLIPFISFVFLSLWLFF